MNKIIYDKICGMIIGHSLGDALGAPSEAVFMIMKYQFFIQ
jgi:ADP-ribosylglycohydrolase